MHGIHLPVVCIWRGKGKARCEKDGNKRRFIRLKKLYRINDQGIAKRKPRYTGLSFKRDKCADDAHGVAGNLLFDGKLPGVDTVGRFAAPGREEGKPCLHPFA